MQLIALAIAPGIAICLFIFHRDAFNREPKLNLFISFILGAAVVLPVALVERSFTNTFNNGIVGTALTAFIGVALIEEMGKFLVFRLYAYPRKSFDEPLDGIVYSVMISMGFASLENWFYVKQFGIQIALIRMFLSVPAHATFGVLMGYYGGSAKFDERSQTSLLLQGIFWAVFFHGLFDFFLFMQQSPALKGYMDEGTASLLFFLSAIASFILALRLSFIHIKKHHRLSQKTYGPTATMSLRPAYPGDIPLIRKMADEVWPPTYAPILTEQQIEYMMNMMYSEESLMKQMTEGNEFFIVYDGAEAVGFSSISIPDPKVYKVNKLYVLPSQQGRGTGAFMLETLTSMIRSRGGDTLRLNVNRFNRAKTFYEKQGFRVIGEEDINIGEGFLMNDYIMERVI